MEYDAAYDDLLQSQNDYAEAAYTIAMVQTKKTDKIRQRGLIKIRKINKKHSFA